MPTAADFRLDATPPLRACNAGLFVSRGHGIHVERVIDSYELIFVKRGLLSMNEDDHDFEIRAGETLLLWPGRRHRGTRPYPPDLSFYWIHFQLRSTRKATRKPGIKEYLLRLPQHATLRRDDRFAELIHRFLDDQETGQLQPLAASLLILLMLAEVGAAHAGGGGSGGRPSDTAAALASRAHALVQTRFHEAISTSDLAAALGCNPDYLGRIYRRTFGRTLVDAIHQNRLRRARRLLLESPLNIDQVARECGFDDSGYFRRIFRKKQGLSPRAFRRLYARAHVNTE